MHGICASHAPASALPPPRRHFIEGCIMNTWPHQSHLTLAAMPNAAYWARRHVENVLAEWQAETLQTDAKLVVSEFISNAVRVVGTLDVQTQAAYVQEPRAVSYVELAQLEQVKLRLYYGSGLLLIEVWDSNEQPPVEQLPDFESENGRGLFVVRAFCEKWGWYPTFTTDLSGEPRQSGKVVWAELVQP
ncbi:ATP-binding protein [Actinomadura spongiicola]|uniref:ATP-binding protein n=2 Tax=Actinomadura spongiicola TaxID=2303421 RepID=A0A372GG25_9ACTN|nr:ATP-binding protein [Actinomadura spongiicola]